MAMAISSSSCSDNKEPWEEQVGVLRHAIEGHTDFETAVQLGYAVDATGYRTGMGHHYINPELLDYTFDIEHPEVMLFVPDENGDMQFVAVEYGIVVDDLNNPPPAPEGYEGDIDQWELNSEFSLWTLHVWIELENEAGIFTPMNPKLD